MSLIKRTSTGFISALALALVAAMPSFGQSMDAPNIILDGEYTYTVKDAPTSYDGLNIVTHRNADEVITLIDIMVNGIKTQSFDLTGAAELTRDDVHYLDANFDGKVDIMVGPGWDREFSVLFLWSPGKKSFVQATDNLVPVFNGTLNFDVRNKDVMCYNAYGVGMTSITRYTWNGPDMLSQEKLVQAMFLRNYEDIICNRYTLIDCNKGNVLASASSPAGLPERWRAYAQVPDAEEEAKIAADDAAYRIEQGMYDEGDDTWVCVTGKKVRLRWSPEIKSNNIVLDGHSHPKYLNKGDKFKYLGYAGDFYEVSYNGAKAYISKRYSILKDK